jgi:hypothetical protein
MKPILFLASLIRARALFSAAPCLQLANSAAPERTLQVLAVANTLDVDEEGWALIPFGDTRHSGRDGRGQTQLSNVDRELVEKARNGVVQRFTRERAEKMVRDFKSFAGRIKRAVVGLNIYKGHPDAPAYAHIFTDKAPRGTIADMQVTDAGLRIRPVLNPQGAADVAGGWREHSPNWNSEYVGDDPASGLPIVEPFEFISLGLVPKGNMPGLSLVNSGGELHPATDSSSTMNKYLMELLTAMGVTIAADADETAQSNAVGQAKGIFAAANAAVSERDTLKTTNADLTTRLTTLEGEKLQLVNSSSTITSERDSLKTQLGEERKARALLLVNSAVVEGRLAAADRDSQVLALCNAADFTKAADDLAKLPKKLKTESVLNNLSQQGREVQDRQSQVLSLVNTAMELPEIKALPMDQRYDAAFTRVQKDPANAGLFAAMHKPAAPTKS